MNLEQIAKLLLWVGAAILVVGGLLYLAARLGLTRLPGTIVFRGENVTVYIPLGFMLVLSLVGSLLLYLLSKR